MVTASLDGGQGVFAAAQLGQVAGLVAQGHGEGGPAWRVRAAPALSVALT